MNFCLFCGGDASEPGHLLHCDGRQGRVESVNHARDVAMAQVADHAAEHDPSFSERARRFVVLYLRRHGPTSGEVLSDLCKQAGIRPHDDRAFGPVYYTLARRGEIRKVGAVRRERGHGTAGGNVWDVMR